MFLFVQFIGSIGVGELNLLAVNWFTSPLMWSMLGPCWCFMLLEFVESLGHLIGHRDVNVAVVIIPL